MNKIITQCCVCVCVGLFMHVYRCATVPVHVTLNLLLIILYHMQVGPNLGVPELSAVAKAEYPV